MQRSNHPISTAVQRGFTLIELLVAITIITILVGLLTWAAFPAVTTAKELEVQAELTSFEKALNDFKLQYGVLPPSSITLYEDSTGWTNVERAVIRKMWPNFDFSLDRDINGDSDTTDTFNLSGAECLTFFLGGMSDGGAPIGFSKNPADPFLVSGSRVGPFHEFDVNRFVDINSNGASEYLDPLVEGDAPIYYIQSDDYSNPTDALTGSGMTDVYRQSANAFWKSQTFQLITPGVDVSYGTGGIFDVDTADTDLSAGREAERDNITNFNQGRLVP